jgi:hypothetical protein
VYTTLTGRWSDIIILNVHAPTEDKINDMKDSFNDELERVLDQFPEYHMKILLDLDAKVGREDTLKPKIGYEINNDFLQRTNLIQTNLISRS